MSDIFKINTEEVVKDLVPQQIQTFNLVSSDDPILRETLPEFDFANPPVNPMEFASSLVETCKKHQGIGLSANQCGFRHRVFVMGADDSYVAHFNPKVLETSNEKHMMEGCLSFPLLGLRITRPEEVTVEYQDFNGNKHTSKYTGISARCFLHELDHMNGIVYTDLVKPLALKSGLDKRNKVIKKMAQYQALMMKQKQHGKNTHRTR
jgi:peptide deformylase